MSDRDQHAESAVAEAAEAFDRLPDAVTDLFGDEATAESAYDLLTVDVPAAAWLTALRTARDALGCTYFDWLSAVDEAGVGFRVCAHVVALGTGTVRRLMVRTTVPHDAAALPSAIDVYAGAAWHERETHEMFGVAFDGHPHLVPLLLPEGFEGHPLRKDFVLAARVAKAWPGAKEPGEPAEGHTGPKRRAMLPPGVPDPNEWGPLKGQLPPAAARPARAARAAADRPPRRTRTASEGSAAQRPTPPPGAEAAPPSGAAAPGADGPAVPGAQAPTPASPETPAALGTPEAPGTPGTPEALGTPEAPGTPAAARPRRSRSASEGSASQRPELDGPGTTPARPARRSRSASDGSASQRPEPAESPAPPPAGPRPASDAPEGPPSRPPRVRSTDAPWHDAQPAFDEPEGPETDSPDEPSQPLRRLRSGGTGAEPPVREGAGRGEAPRSGPTPTEAAPTEATDSETESAPTPDKPTPEHPTPDHPAGGDPE
ncbi:NADH-quinone oxidoreductase subunit C [Streptomyces sp. ME02-6979.5a]|uniref:NADH-quinone oxidoreductase subunit C n=1 Tax=Streptomyces sp. ME02-6979.5a TaxID=462925 RepID=UPI0029B3E5F7|nr:NADH-quinone oxidoreductase subunit C [Streptomyces sp. ME02-6979.5a]MDX3336436.1 NADH-quinone oxidoreductase subunit C [Streptomyces sp. ME02-6979.5a]